MRDPKSVSYVFDPAAHTIDFSAMPGFNVKNLLGIAHPVVGLIYSPGKASIGLVDVDGALLTLKFNTTSLGANDPLIVMYEDGINRLPPDAATATRQDAQKIVLQDIRDAIKAQRTETIWTDDTGTRFIRLDNAGTISWTDVAGDPSPPPGTGARPDSDSSTVVSQSTYRAIADGAGFANNDYLNHIVVTDGDAGDLVSNFWLNVTAGSKIAAPSAAAISPLAPLPDGAATAARQDTGNESLASILAGIGAPGDTAPATDVAPGSLVARLARLLSTATGLSARQDVGNASLAEIATGIGAPADEDPGSDAAAGTVLARLARLLVSITGLATLLTAIRDRLAGTLDTQLAAGTNVVGRIGLQVGGVDLDPAHPLPTQERAAQGVIALTPDAAAVTPGRLFAVIATSSGNVQVVFADGSGLTVPVTPGFQAFPFAVKQVVAAGTTAAGTFANLT